MIPIRFPPIPEDTARATEAAFGKDHPYLKIGDGLALVFSDVNLEQIASADAALVDTFWPHSLATILQYLEDLTDRQMENATRTRIDLKYALHLPLVFPGINPAGLCFFRQRLLFNETGKQALRQMVGHLESFFGYEGKLSSDSDLILSTICMISRWERVIGTMNSAVEAMAASHPQWLRTVMLPHWYRRYYYKHSAAHFPRASKNLKASLQSVGEDGRHLLNAVEKSGNPNLMKLRELRNLREEWQIQFETQGNQSVLRTQTCSNCDSRS